MNCKGCNREINSGTHKFEKLTTGKIVFLCYSPGHSMWCEICDSNMTDENHSWKPIKYEGDHGLLYDSYELVCLKLVNKYI